MIVFEFVIAVAAGILAGLTGGGGGMLFVPVLVFAGLPPVEAIATSNVGILITSISGTISNVRAHEMPWRRVLLIGIPAVLLAPLGAFVALRLPATALLLSFAVLNIVNAVLSGRGARSAEDAGAEDAGADDAGARRSDPARIAVTGGSGGFLAGLFGIGGGLVVVPLQLLWLRTPIKVAARVSLAVIVLSSSSAIFGHALQDGGIHWGTGLVLGVGGLIGAPIGAHLLRRITAVTATRILQTVLVCVALLLIAKVFTQ
jgi:uncharacterized membrane protein YfcA